MNAALDEAERFLAPVLNRTNSDRHGRSIVQVLSGHNSVAVESLDAEETDKRRWDIIDKALGILGHLHSSCVNTSNGIDQLEPLSNQRGQKVVNALLDLVVLEGIYPSVSSGVGVPVERRLKSALKGEFTIRSLGETSGGRLEDKRLLIHVVDRLCPISLSRKGLASSIQHRMSVDLIAAVGELAFSPAWDNDTRRQSAPSFKEIIESQSALELFPQLTSLLHPSCPDWFRSALSFYLSVLPLRPDGVRQIINFIAGSASDESGTPGTTLNQSTGPSVSLEALVRASKLLTSVPSTMTPDAYISALAPQLLDLLDDSALDNKRIASYIIGTGFLSKRKLGSPGTAGWRCFAQPIFDAIDPWLAGRSVSETTLKLAIDRLSTLAGFHSNPGLTKRLVGPNLLPLWGLQCYALEHRRTNLANQVHAILSTYMKISATETQFLDLSDSLLWNGTALLSFASGATGGIEIRKHDAEEANQVDSVLETVDGRVVQYLSLLREAVLTDDQLSKIFAHTSKAWLLGRPSQRRLEALGDDTKDPLLSLVHAKLTYKLLETYKSQITSSLEGIFQLVDPILSAFVAEHRQAEREKRRSDLSLIGLGKIIRNGDEAEDGSQDADGTISSALALLSTVMINSDVTIGNTDSKILDRVQESLNYIAKTQFSDSSLGMTASNVLLLLQSQQGTPIVSKTNEDTKDFDSLADDRNSHRKALGFLSNELAPVRAQGLSTLTDLVSKSSPVLNIPSTGILLVSLLQDEDEYIYLSAIKTLGLLASNHPKTIVTMLVEKYVDAHEDSALDVRIKIGETLNKTIEHLGQLFVETIAQTVGESMIAVASRRGERPKALQKRDRAKRKAAKARKEAEDAWNGEIPGEGDGEEDMDEEGAMNAHVAKIVDGWADTGREEDIRIRTSALSILGTAIETNVAGVGASVTSTAVDCALAVLKLEKGEERAILRRAAVMVIMSVVRAIDAAEDRGQRLGFGFAGENLAEVVTVLRYVEVTDGDEVVVGHVRAVVESLEAWRQKSLLLGSVRSREAHPPYEVGFSLRGEPAIGGTGKTVRIEEVT
ncbi:MAG: hypothetical protein LQ348_005356 [Seirophora lacunosa]|nr:MAG: hypothetical protein LQ348_005356 [Seirophora lacunosa]